MTEMNFETARFNMIEQQIKPWKVMDPVTLNAMDTIPREDFVPDALKESAFSDYNLPLDCGQCMLSPVIEAKILQAVQLKETDKVLEVGTGSGYLTALIAHMAKQVISVEIHPSLSEQAQTKFENLGLDNICLVVADAADGYLDKSPYDVIILTGSIPKITDTLKNSLRLGGRLFAVVGTGHMMEATLITRVSEQQFSCESMFETYLPPLENIKADNTFIL